VATLAPVDIDAAPHRLTALPSWLLSQASLPAQRLVALGLEREGARRQHYSVLAALDEFGPASQIDLGRRCGIDRSDMVALLNTLAADDLVGRSEDPDDRRRNVITLTAAGRRRLRRLDGVIAGLEDDLLAPLSERERRELVRLLTLVVQHHAD
jgi:MarR family transcriptional regulator, lower aerobic nicotinate degradation pathway regulator